MNTLRWTLMAIFLGATCAHAQPVTGEGRVPAGEPAPKPSYVLEGRAALRAAGLIPKGYAYTFEGQQDGNTITYTKLELRAPGDEPVRAVKLEYVAQVDATSVAGPEGRRFAGISGAAVPLVDSQIGRLVLERAGKTDASLVFTLRGWKVTRTLAGGADEVSFLVLASHARGGLGGKTYWVTEVQDSGWGGHWSLTRVDDPTKGLGLAHFLCSISARPAPAESAGLAGSLR